MCFSTLAAVVEKKKMLIPNHEEEAHMMMHKKPSAYNLRPPAPNTTAICDLTITPLTEKSCCEEKKSFKRKFQRKSCPLEK